MADQNIEWPAGVGGEIEEALFSIASQETLVLKGAADTFGHALDERLQVSLTWGLDSPEHRWLGADKISPVEHEGGRLGCLEAMAVAHWPAQDEAGGGSS